MRKINIIIKIASLIKNFNQKLFKQSIYIAILFLRENVELLFLKLTSNILITIDIFDV
jgi:hypothetical protein